MKGIKHYILKPLTLIGALNWGLIGLFGFDLVAWIFGGGTTAARIVYSLIGIAALICIIMMIMPRDER